MKRGDGEIKRRKNEAGALVTRGGGAERSVTAATSN